ncbi:MAG: putative pilus assembly protein [Fibrobacteres bacterium]|nr:putative pilus assembly protein [Fibrobacterota bacterium]
MSRLRYLLFPGLLVLAQAVPRSMAASAPEARLPPVGSAACDDDFSGAALAPAWSFLDADGEPGGAARLVGGKLELIGRGSDAFKDVNEFVGVKRAGVPGDFDVSVKIESQAATHGWAQAGILAANDAADPSKGGYVLVDATPANGFHAFFDGAGTQGTLDTHVDVGTSAYPVWLRLARTGLRFSAWYRTGSLGGWVPIAEGFSAQGTASASQLALVSLSHNDSADGKAVFDDFLCQGSAVTLGPGAGPGRLRTGARSAPAPAPALRYFSVPEFDARGRFVLPGDFEKR